MLFGDDIFCQFSIKLKLLVLIISRWGEVSNEYLHPKAQSNEYLQILFLREICKLPVNYCKIPYLVRLLFKYIKFLILTKF